MTYTGNRSLQYLSVPVYAIFKNLTIIAIAYGEVLLFGSRVTSITLFSFGLMVLSAILAAWADIQHAIQLTYDRGLIAGMGDPETVSGMGRLQMLNLGYAWMGLNVTCTAAYVLDVRRVIKSLGFRDWDSKLTSILLALTHSYDICKQPQLTSPQQCTTTTSSHSLSSSSVPSFSNPGLRRIFSLIFRHPPEPPSSQQRSTPAPPQYSYPMPPHGAFVSRPQPPTPW